jgi:hypothetical protein
MPLVGKGEDLLQADILLATTNAHATPPWRTTCSILRSYGSRACCRHVVSSDACSIGSGHGQLRSLMEERRLTF